MVEVRDDVELLYKHLGIVFAAKQELVLTRALPSE